eukprot:4912744-Amphidinium_carterae.2
MSGTSTMEAVLQEKSGQCDWCGDGNLCCRKNSLRCMAGDCCSWCYYTKALSSCACPCAGIHLNAKSCTTCSDGSASTLV